MNNFSKDFDINNVGYLLRNNSKKIHVGLAFTNTNPGDQIIEKTFNIQAIYSLNMDDIDLIKDISLNWEINLKKYWNIKLSYLKSFEHYNDWLLGGTNNMLTQDSIVIKQPESDEINISFRSSPIKNMVF